MHTLTNTCTPLWSNTRLAWGLTVKRNWGHWMLPKDQESVPEPESSPHPLIKYTCWTRPSGVQPPSTPFLPADRTQFYSGDSIFNSQRWKLVQPKPFHGCRISICPFEVGCVFISSSGLGWDWHVAPQTLQPTLPKWKRGGRGALRPQRPTTPEPGGSAPAWKVRPISMFGGD